MLAKRIIPTILCRGRQMVKGRQFDSWRSVGLVAQAVRIHQTRAVDELVLLDIMARAEGRGPDLDLIAELSEVCFMPLAVGGGIRSVDDARAVLKAGADKVVIGTDAFGGNTVHSIAQRMGSQAVVVAIDVRYGRPHTHNGTQRLHLRPQDWAARQAERGAGEILLTSIEREGTMRGYDLDLIHAVSISVPIPVIAHGGCGSYEHMRQALEAGADAVAAGAFFQFTDATPAGAARYLQERGVETRT